MHVMITANAAWNVWNFRRAIAGALLSEGHRITVLAPPDESTASLEAMGCRIMPLEIEPKSINPADDLSLLARFRRCFGVERPDVVLSYTIKNNIFGALAARSCRIPFIPNVSGLGTAFLSGGLMQTLAEFLYRRAFKGLPLVFFQNGDDQAHFLARRLVREDQVRLLPGSGIDLQRFAPADYPSAHEPVRFLMIARLLRDKGVVEYAEAARILKREHPDLRFELLGQLGSANRSAIDGDMLTSWQSAGIIDYLGTAPDVRPFIARSQCVVLPSYREGAPRTLIEAAAMARPVITTDVPGCRSVVLPDQSGFLCAPRDAESLASAMRRFLALPHDQRASMGRAGRKLMEERFDEALVIRAYREAIAKVTAAHG